jgi:hypothetical protein
MIHPARRRRRVAAIALAIAVVLACGACSGDDDDEAGSDSSSDDASTTAPPTTTSDEEPPGTEPAAVEPYIDELLQRYDEVVSQITSDAAVAANSEDPLYGQLREIMAPESSMTEPIIEALVNRGEQGVSQRAYEDGTLPVQRSVDGDVTTVSPTEVRFPICARFNYRLYRGDQQFQISQDRTERSEGTALLVDGHWLIDRLEGRDDAVGCEEAA